MINLSTIDVPSNTTFTVSHALQQSFLNQLTTKTVYRLYEKHAATLQLAKLLVSA